MVSQVIPKNIQAKRPVHLKDRLLELPWPTSGSDAARARTAGVGWGIERSGLRSAFRRGARVQRAFSAGFERVLVTVRSAPVFAFDLGIGGEINLEMVGLPVLKKGEVGELHLAALAFDAIVDGHHGVPF